MPDLHTGLTELVLKYHTETITKTLIYENPDKTNNSEKAVKLL